MPSATPRRQSSHRRRRSTNTPNQPSPPRAQSRRGGISGNTTAPGKSVRRTTQGATSSPQASANPGSAPKQTAPLPPLELELAPGTPAVPPPPPHPASDAPPTVAPVADHPHAAHLAGTRTPPPGPGAQLGGALIPPLPTIPALPRATFPPARTPPAPLSPPSHQTNAVESAAQQRRQTQVTRRRQRAPNVRAALAYAIPFAPAIWLLAHERRARFIRLHAAQSLAFFGLLALGQVALYVALINLGQAITDSTASLALGLLFLLLFGFLGVGGFCLWLRLLTDAMTGKLRRYPFLSRLAALIERRGFRSRAARKE
ncbi:MAG TPA: hypothetical protein VF510_02360 [Ktedonobacterales bacterium]